MTMSEIDDLVHQGPSKDKSSPPAVSPRPDNPIRILNYQQMMQMPAPAWLIEGILPERALALMFGTSNSFKSFLALDMACHIATGLDWHGQTIKQGPVVYIASEGVTSLVRQRIAGWAHHRHIASDARFCRILEQSA